jgi:predicted  nucleic acid-binding Zn-ribbon protein
MHPDLQALLDLQDKDRAVDAVNAALSALLPEEQALDEELAGLARTLAEAQRSVEAASSRKNEQATRIAGYKQLQDRRKQQLDFVRTPKETQALMAEIDMARGVLVKEEADHTRSGDAITDAEKRVKAAEEAHQEAADRQVEARSAIEAKRKELQGQLEAAKAERKTAAAEVKPPLLVKYDRTRRGRAPAAVFPLRKDSCGHCFTAVPVQRRMLIQQGASIESCEVCGVLLYAPDA